MRMITRNEKRGVGNRIPLNRQIYLGFSAVNDSPSGDGDVIKVLYLALRLWTAGRFMAPRPAVFVFCGSLLTPFASGPFSQRDRGQGREES